MARKLFYSTRDLITQFKPSLTSYFDVYVRGSSIHSGADAINFMAYEAVIPGSSFELGQVFGDRQGITEQYPTKRVYPPVDVSFYVDSDYKVIKFFEDWMATIQPNLGVRGSSYAKFNYPNSYETEVIITKFEREFRDGDPKKGGNRLNDSGNSGVYNEPKQIKYTLLNAYPSNVISLPLSYSQADVLRTTVTFNYDLYSVEYVNSPNTSSTEINKPSEDKSLVRGPN